LIKVFRPDKFNPIAFHLVKAVLGEECTEDYTIDFKNAIQSIKSKEPILLSSAPGFDPSFKVEQLSKETNTKLHSVAIGSAEGFELADKAIKECVKTGNWIMLKNVHLAPTWLSELEKKIHVLNPHANFRLFLTAEFSPKIPSTLIRQSYKLVFEPAAGIKASLVRTYKTVLSPARSDRLPVERSRLHFLLGWLHAVILERLRYTPIGWTKVYEFNEADQRCGLDLIDEYIDAMGSRNNIDINKIPWDAFKTILIENLYGGKVDNDYDSKILISLVEMFFTPESFDANYPLFKT
jgi:dynein heavy chain 1, cytosolic